MSDQELVKLARSAIGQFNCPKAYRDLPTSQKAFTFITLPSGHVIKLFGFAHQRQTATVVRKHLRHIVPVKVEHAVVASDDHSNRIETRGSFIDHETTLSRRSI